LKVSAVPILSNVRFQKRERGKFCMVITMQHMTEAQRVMVIAGLAGADVRTVKKFVKGEPIKGVVLRERLAAAAKQAAQIQASSEEQVNA
jgi:hypothetical protein